MKCHHKNRYATRKQAKGAAALAFRDFGVECRAYKCPTCHYWHLTSQADAREVA